MYIEIRERCICIYRDVSVYIYICMQKRIYVYYVLTMIGIMAGNDESKNEEEEKNDDDDDDDDDDDVQIIHTTGRFSG